MRLFFICAILILGANTPTLAFSMSANDLGAAFRKPTREFRVNERSNAQPFEVIFSGRERVIEASTATNRVGESFLKLRTVVYRSETEVSPEIMMRLEFVNLSGGDKAFFSLRWNGLHRGGKYGNESWDLILEENIRLERLSETELNHALKRFAGDAEEIQASIPTLIHH